MPIFSLIIAKTPSSCPRLNGTAAQSQDDVRSLLLITNVRAHFPWERAVVTRRWWEARHSTRADVTFRGQRSWRAARVCLSECDILLVCLALILLALLLSMILNIIFCLQQRAYFFQGTALKRGMFLELSTVSVNLCLLSTQTNAASTTGKSTLLISPFLSGLNLFLSSNSF